MNLHRLDLVSLFPVQFNLVVRRQHPQGRGAGAHGGRCGEQAHLRPRGRRRADLFERHSRGVTLTLAGRRCTTRQRILSDVDQLRRTCRINASASSASCACGPTRRQSRSSARRFSRRRAQHPGIRIELDEQNSTDVGLAVLDGRADIASCGPHAAPRLADRVYRAIAIVLVRAATASARRRKKIAFADATEFDFRRSSLAGTSAGEATGAGGAGAVAGACGCASMSQLRRDVPDGGVGLGIAGCPMRRCSRTCARWGAQDRSRRSGVERELLIGARYPGGAAAAGAIAAGALAAVVVLDPAFRKPRKLRSRPIISASGPVFPQSPPNTRDNPWATMRFLLRLAGRAGDRDGRSSPARSPKTLGEFGADVIKIEPPGTATRCATGA